MKFFRNLIIILLVLVGVAWFAVSPASQITPSQRVAQADSQEFQTALGQVATNFSFSDQGVTSQLSLDQSAFNGLLKTALTNQDQNLLNGSYELKNRNVVAKIPYKILGLIQSQIELELLPSISDGHLQVQVSGAKLGRISLPSGMIEQLLQEQVKKNPTLTVTGKTLQLPVSQEMGAIKQIHVQEGKMLVDFQVDASDLLGMGLAALANQAS